MATAPSIARKGERTRTTILDAALRVASRDGLDQLTIGTLASATGMSKSGLFAHFGSRTELQLAVLDRGREKFTDVVFKPALAHPRGLTRFRALFVNWIDWTASAELPGGCVMLGAAMEFDDRPGAIRDHIVRDQRDWIDVLRRCLQGAMAEGELAEGTDIEQMLFECFGISTSYYYHRRLFADTRARHRALEAHEALIERYRAPAAPAVPPNSPRRRAAR